MDIGTQEKLLSYSSIYSCQVRYRKNVFSLLFCFKRKDRVQEFPVQELMNWWIEVLVACSSNWWIDELMNWWIEVLVACSCFFMSFYDFLWVSTFSMIFYDFLWFSMIFYDFLNVFMISNDHYDFRSKHVFVEDRSSKHAYFIWSKSQ